MRSLLTEFVTLMRRESFWTLYFSLFFFLHKSTCFIIPCFYSSLRSYWKWLHSHICANILCCSSGQWLLLINKKGAYVLCVFIFFILRNKNSMWIPRRVTFGIFCGNVVHCSLTCESIADGELNLRLENILPTKNDDLSWNVVREWNFVSIVRRFNSKCVWPVTAVGLFQSTHKHNRPGQFIYAHSCLFVFHSLIINQK